MEGLGQVYMLLHCKVFVGGGVEKGKGKGEGEGEVGSKGIS